MVFGRKKETTAVKLTRAAGRRVAEVVSNTRKAAKRAVVRRKARKTLERTGRSLRTVGKAAAVVGLTAAAAATVSEIVKRRRNA